jgi:hypothetical protein
MAKLIEDATGPVLEEHLEGLSHQDLVEDSLVSLIFCDHSGDVKDNSTDYRDLPKIRIPHVVELMVERMSSIENLPSEQRNKELPDYKNKSSDDNFVRGTMMLFRFAEVGERPMDGHEDIAYSREKRNNVLRFASLKTRIRETTIKAAREKSHRRQANANHCDERGTTWSGTIGATSRRCCGDHPRSKGSIHSPTV